MPSASAAGGTPQLPPSLQADHREFANTLSSGLGPAGADINVLHRLTKFGLLVYEQADRLGLISRRDLSSLFTRHVLDSLNPISLFDHAPISALDVGSGAGFPGIPLAVFWPETSMTLIESREKKAAFLERAVRELGLRNARVAPMRFEDLAGEPGTHSQGSPRESGFDAVFIRALGSLPKLLSMAGPVCAPGARWVYFLGGGTSSAEVMEELRPLGLSAAVATGALGGQLLHGRFGGDE
jgi:16S rRNA (guanine527-N7)-methyltransferase